MSKKNHVYLIAGEASGDFIGAQLIAALKAEDPDIQISGVGGKSMQSQGLKSLFPMEDLSVMGVAEILPRLPKLIGRINETVTDIMVQNPDVVITIDAPDFSFRVHKAIRKKMHQSPRQIHYVAPTVWAWRERRALKVSEFLDAMICLFDFEPPYFEKVGLKSIAVGHPMMESNIIDVAPALIGEDKNTKIGLFLGSRRGELKRTAPVLIDAVHQIKKQHENIELIVPTLPHLEKTVTEMLSELDIPMTIIMDQQDKWSVFKACDVALAVSGTVGLELAVANVPHIVAYKAAPLTAFIVRRLIKTPFAHLANILLDEYVVPEFIQEDCNSNLIAEKISDLIKNQSISDYQKFYFDKVREKLGAHNKPSQKAAQFLLPLFNRYVRP